jgi:alpha-tubulin suppressor-like RCC1 family protein
MTLANHAYVLLEDNSVWAIGDNTYGQLGIGKEGGSSETPVKMMENIMDISSGGRHGVLLDYKGRIHCVGDSTLGQCGFINMNKEFFPKQLIIQDFLYKDPDKEWNELEIQPEPVTGDLVKKDVVFKSISSGFSHSGGVDIYGNVWMTGTNNRSQCGPGKTDDSVVKFWYKLKLTDERGKRIQASQISCGYDFTIIISKDGSKIYGWGNNEFAELGIGNSFPISTPVLILEALPENTVLKLVNLKNSGTMTSSTISLAMNTPENTGTPDSNSPEHRTGVNIFTKIDCSSKTVFALERDGTLWSWGYWGNSIYAYPKKIFENVLDFSISNDKVYVSTYNTDLQSNVYSISTPLWRDAFGEALVKDGALRFEEHPTNKVRKVSSNRFMVINASGTDWEKLS